MRVHVHFKSLEDSMYLWLGRTDTKNAVYHIGYTTWKSSILPQRYRVFVKSCTSIFDIPPLKQFPDDKIYMQRPISLHKSLVKHIFEHFEMHQFLNESNIGNNLHKSTCLHQNIFTYNGRRPKSINNAYPHSNQVV